VKTMEAFLNFLRSCFCNLRKSGRTLVLTSLRELLIVFRQRLVISLGVMHAVIMSTKPESFPPTVTVTRYFHFPARQRPYKRDNRTNVHPVNALEGLGMHSCCENSIYRNLLLWANGHRPQNRLRSRMNHPAPHISDSYQLPLKHFASFPA